MSHQKIRHFSVTGFKFKIAAEDKSCVQTVETNRSIFQDPELQLIVRIKVKMLCENLKTPMWHFDNGWRHEVIYQICFCGDEFEILQHSTSNYYVSGKMEICIWHCPMFSDSNNMSYVFCARTGTWDWWYLNRLCMIE